jgi:hypothetical protein
MNTDMRFCPQKWFGGDSPGYLGCRGYFVHYGNLGTGKSPREESPESRATTWRILATTLSPSKISLPTQMSFILDKSDVTGAVRNALIKNHAIKKCERNGGIADHILNLACRFRWLFSKVYLWGISAFRVFDLARFVPIYHHHHHHHHHFMDLVNLLFRPLILLRIIPSSSWSSYVSSIRRTVFVGL